MRFNQVISCLGLCLMAACAPIVNVDKIGTGTMTQSDFRSYMREIALRRDQNRITVRNLSGLFSGLTSPRLPRLS